MGKIDELIQTIADSGDEKVMNAFLAWQDEGIKAKERLIEKLNKLLKEREGKPDATSENSLHKHAVIKSVCDSKCKKCGNILDHYNNKPFCSICNPQTGL